MATIVQRFELPRRPRGRWQELGCVAAVTLPVIVAATFLTEFVGNWSSLLLIAAFGFGAVAAQVRSNRARVFVGQDGVELQLAWRKSFIAYRAIEAVCHLSPKRAAAGLETWWRVELGLKSGVGVAFATNPGKLAHDELGESIVAAVQAARDAANDANSLGELSTLLRRPRSAEAWIATLRHLGEQSVGGYRSGVVGMDRLEAIAGHPGVPLALRASAAIALRATGGGWQLPEIAKGIVHERHRRALLRVAKAETDGSLAQALHDLEAAEDSALSAERRRGPSCG
jgi:hypothetical protein